MPPLLRLATPNDAAQVLAVYAPYCHTPISFELEPPSVEEMRQRLTKVLARFPWLVCEEDGRVSGYAYAGPHRERPAYCWSVDATVYVHQQQHRRGIGRTLYTCLFQLLRLQGYVNAYAGVTLPNPASVRLHESVGFQRIGVYANVGYKCGAWHDVAWFQLLLQPRPLEPRPPSAWPDVERTVEWRSALNAELPLPRESSSI